MTLNVATKQAVSKHDACCQVLNLIRSNATMTESIVDLNTFLLSTARRIYRLFHQEHLTDNPSFDDGAKFCIRALSMDCIAVCRGNEDRAMAHEAICCIIWRSCLMFAMAAANGMTLSKKKTENTFQLIKKVIPVPGGEFLFPKDDILCKMIDSASLVQAGDLETMCGNVLRELGYDIKSPVRQYAHPIDSALVGALDSGLINDLIRSFVNFNADSAMGQLIASAIPVTETNYPVLNSIVDECVDLLGIQRPYVIVTNRIGGINAMAFGSDEEPYIAVTSLLVKIMSEEQMRFVIGHECGHIAMGHMIYHTAANIFRVFSSKIPVVGKIVYNTMGTSLNSWARRSEITADRAGLHCCGSPDMAKKTLLQIECAFNSAEEVDLNAYMENSRDYLRRGTIRKLGEFSSDHPLTPKRIRAIDVFTRSEQYYEMFHMDVPENALGREELNREIESILRVL